MPSDAQAFMEGLAGGIGTGALLGQRHQRIGLERERGKREAERLADNLLTADQNRKSAVQAMKIAAAGESRNVAAAPARLMALDLANKATTTNIANTESAMAYRDKQQGIMEEERLAGIQGNQISSRATLGTGEVQDNRIAPTAMPPMRGSDGRAAYAESLDQAQVSKYLDPKYPVALQQRREEARSYAANPGADPQQVQRVNNQLLGELEAGFNVMEYKILRLMAQDDPASLREATDLVSQLGAYIPNQDMQFVAKPGKDGESIQVAMVTRGTSQPEIPWSAEYKLSDMPDVINHLHGQAFKGQGPEQVEAAAADAKMSRAERMADLDKVVAEKIKLLREATGNKISDSVMTAEVLKPIEMLAGEMSEGLKGSDISKMQTEFITIMGKAQREGKMAPNLGITIMDRLRNRYLAAGTTGIPQ